MRSSRAHVRPNVILSGKGLTDAVGGRGRPGEPLHDGSPFKLLGNGGQAHEHEPRIAALDAVRSLTRRPARCRFASVAALRREPRLSSWNVFNRWDAPRGIPRRYW